LIGPGDALEPATSLVGLKRLPPQGVGHLRHPAYGVELLGRHVSERVDDAARLPSAGTASAAARGANGRAEGERRRAFRTLSRCKFNIDS
jgi:hypothetical protein